MGIDVSAAALARSFPLRWFVNALYFLLAWGVLVVVAWTLIGGRDTLATNAVSAVIGSVLYGLLVATDKSRGTQPL